MAKGDKIKVVGYAQRQFFNDGIEYRNFTDDLVGNQLTSDSDGTDSVFTFGNFVTTVNFDGRDTRVFSTKKFSPFKTLSDLQVDEIKSKALVNNNVKVKLNIDRTNLSSFAYFGSSTEYIRVSLENIIINWPASLYLNPVNINSLNSNASGYTFEDYNYDFNTNKSSFKVNTNFIDNKFSINYKTNGTTIDTFNEGNDLRNLTVNYLDYVISFDEKDYSVIGFTGSTELRGDYIYFQVVGNPFGSFGLSNYTPKYHIKPNSSLCEQFFNGLNEFESYLLNRLVTPKYTSTFKFKEISEIDGTVTNREETVTWPSSDGYNIDFNTDSYINYVNSLLNITTSKDESQTDLISRFFVAEAVSDFDTLPKCDGDLDEPEAGQKINKTLRVYGREFDEVKKYMDGISYANTVTYDKKNNMPDQLVKYLARVLGWELTSSIVENDLIKTFLNTSNQTYKGFSRGLTPNEAEIELWRRLILNSPWIWKSKGTRKAAEFFFSLIGVPNGLINFDEYVYVAKEAIDMDLFYLVLENNNLEPDLDLYNVDEDGYPKFFRNNSDMYFQKGGLWYRQTAGSGATQFILEGNNPHVGPYDGGKEYIAQLENIIPNFSAFTITSTTVTTDADKIFLNYNSGLFNDYVGDLYIDLVSLDGLSTVDANLTSTIIQDPCEIGEETDCGCVLPEDDKALKNYVEISSQVDYKIVLNPDLSDSIKLTVAENETCTIDIFFDYLTQFECSQLNANYDTILESLDIRFTVDTYDKNTGLLTSVYEGDLINIGSGNLETYIESTSGNTGISVTGDTNSCATFNAAIASIDTEYTDWPNSCWRQFQFTIDDQSVISNLANKDIKFTIKVLSAPVNMSVLLDRIKINKICDRVDNVERFISEPPKFELTRVVDNKKSWLSNKETELRRFDLKYRGTEYETNNHKLVVNSKEVDLNLSPARAVEDNTWSYIKNNNCILEGCSDTSFSAFTCPSGYTADPDNDSCSRELTASTSGMTAYTITEGYNTNSTTYNLKRGTLFVQDVEMDDLPIYWTGTPVDSWVGPYYNSDYLVTSNGDYLNHTGFGEKRTLSGALVYSSPEAFSGPLSIWGSNSDVTHPNGFLNPNLLWGGAYATEAGRFRKSVIWMDSTLAPVDEWIGISKTLELNESKTYRLGFGSTNNIRIKVNGKYLFNTETAPNFPKETYNVFDILTIKREAQAWTVVGLKLPSGKNIIEVEGLTTSSSAPMGIGFEIYDATESELKNMRFESELENVMVFSTKDLIGSNYQLGEVSGLTCPDGYMLDTSVSYPYYCTKIERTFREDKQTDCCTPGTPILVKDYDNSTVELPLTASTSAITVSDINTLISGFTGTTTIGELETKNCGEVYAVGTFTADTFDGYWIATENDSTLGVYKVYWESGTTETYDNVSSSLTSASCTLLGTAFEEYSNLKLQGVNDYPTIAWDTNLSKCVYRKCGDDGSINVDDLLVTELSEIDTVNEFSTVLSSELIDVKNRQTLNSYPTLKMLYDRYNYHALEYCDVDSAKLDYEDMDKFGQTVGDYWIDLIEQVIPATTLWGSNYEYRNTFFDSQKYKYKSNNTYFCDNPESVLPFTATTNSSVDVIVETLPNPGDTGTTTQNISECSEIYIINKTSNSEFLGSVTVMGPGESGGGNYIVAP
jgi:hypothetical protein